jgi:hypothetical protein
MEEFQLRSSFVDVCKGFTHVSWQKKSVYIKHFSHFEQFELEKERKVYFDLARSRKIDMREDKIKWLNREKMWTQEDDKKLIQAKSYAENLRKTRDKAVIKAQIESIQKQLNEAETSYYKLFNKKETLIGLTAESYAEQKMQNAYVALSFYNDNLCKERLFTEKQFKKLDEEEVDELLELYVNYLNSVTSDVLRNISIRDFFCKYFYLTEDLTKFFGKPIMDLTFNQVNLGEYGLYFKRLLRDYDVPDKIRENPDEIEKYVIRLQNKKNMKLPTEGRVGVIGATKEGDGDFFGQEENYINDLIKKGGVNDIFDAHNKSKK